MILTAIHDPRLIEKPRVVLKSFWKEAKEKFVSLAKEGCCDPLMLYDSLAMVKPLQECLPALDLRELRRFAAHLERDLKKMDKLVPSHKVPMAVEVEKPTTEEANALVAAEQAQEGKEYKGPR